MSHPGLCDSGRAVGTRGTSMPGGVTIPIWWTFKVNMGQGVHILVHPKGQLVQFSGELSGPCQVQVSDQFATSWPFGCMHPLTHVDLEGPLDRDRDTPGRTRVPPEPYLSHTDQGVTHTICMCLIIFFTMQITSL